MQKAILKSRIQFTTLLKVISEEEGGGSVDELHVCAPRVRTGIVVELEHLSNGHLAPHAGKATRWLPVATASSLLFHIMASSVTADAIGGIFCDGKLLTELKATIDNILDGIAVG
ncbi:hypothetical protein DFH08DRAFT_828415 [Mycena albidolilacea]|uniref:Uncharacterized protein n=1 Tax=Mycena albidolilacea TaxID=1033008 RepID=A0AAD7E766_9AGAR|nr:hypothetical protein DFH08DRAFT_828415 [Mycena albidolilacea]